MNPIYVDYYVHEGCMCFKIDLPWTQYAKHTTVLCRVDQGLSMAKTLAIGVVNKHLTQVLAGEPR